MTEARAKKPTRVVVVHEDKVVNEDKKVVNEDDADEEATVLARSLLHA